MNLNKGDYVNLTYTKKMQDSTPCIFSILSILYYSQKSRFGDEPWPKVGIYQKWNF